MTKQAQKSPLSSTTPKKPKVVNPLAIPEDSSEEEIVETDEDAHKRALFEQKAAHLAERIF